MGAGTRARAALLAGLALVSGACTDQPKPTPIPRLADGSTLPEGCDGAVPGASETVAFAAAGRAWTLDPTRGRLSCLFEVADPGPFTWGPLADRVLLASLEVRGIGAAPGRDAAGIAPAAVSWGRPTGKSLVYVPPEHDGLFKAHPATTSIEDVTPIRRSRFLNIAYHPSGLAFAFVVERSDTHAIWIASNTGLGPRRLVFSQTGSRFQAIAFARDGRRLLYGAVVDGAAELNEVSVATPSNIHLLWSGRPGDAVIDVWPGRGSRDVAFTTGSACAGAVARVRTSRRPLAAAALPHAAEPTHVLGWLDARTILVSSGGCGEPMDLAAVDADSLEATTLALDVDAGSVRVPAPTPPPPLPDGGTDDTGVA
jgi:hypothetical protein